jgi:hypothetical protein
LVEDAGAVRPLIRLLKIWSIEVKEQGNVSWSYEHSAAYYSWHCLRFSVVYSCPAHWKIFWKSIEWRLHGPSLEIEWILIIRNNCRPSILCI